MNRAKIFLLSPARIDGIRGQALLGDASRGALAKKLRSGDPVTLGEVFSYLSSLYFRGKLRYAITFGSVEATYIITSNRGVLPAHYPVTIQMLRNFAHHDIHHETAAYRTPLERSLRNLSLTHADADYILLGSITSEKYVLPLLEVFPRNIFFPSEFIGRGDMSRGGLLLRSARSGNELSYEPLAATVARTGRRAPRLTDDVRYR